MMTWRIAEAIRRRGTYPWSAWEIATEIGVCRQTVYKHIARLRDMGHRIEGEPRMGFMSRLL